jgi:DNA-binding NarL/FixJ family response regulator
VRDCDVVVVDKCFQDASYPQRGARIPDLTRREREVLYWMRVGQHNHEIAKALDVSRSTIGFHIRNLLEKLGARNRIEAINRADQLGL